MTVCVRVCVFAHLSVCVSFLDFEYVCKGLSSVPADGLSRIMRIEYSVIIYGTLYSKISLAHSRERMYGYTL